MFETFNKISFSFYLKKEIKKKDRWEETFDPLYTLTNTLFCFYLDNESKR